MNAGLRPAVGIAGPTTSFADRDTWLSWRAESDALRIGASSVASILGWGHDDPWIVWAKAKRRHLLPTERPDARREQGHEWERRLAVIYADEQRVKLRATPYLVQQVPGVPWLFATTDYRIIGDLEIPLEIKTDSRDDALIEWTFLAGEGTDLSVIDRVPDLNTIPLLARYVIQVQVQMAATGAPYAILCGGIARFGMPDIRTIRVERDDAFIAQMIAEVGAWRDRYLVGDDEPPALDDNTAIRAARLRYTGRDKARLATPDEQADITAWGVANDAKKAAESEADAIKRRLVEGMGDHARIYGDAGSVSITDRQVTITPRKVR